MSYIHLIPAKQLHIFWLIIVVVFFFTGCAKNEQSFGENNILFSPTYSIPVGEIATTFEDILAPYKNQLVRVPENFENDTISTFLYEDIQYFSLVSFDTVVYKSFNFSNITSHLDYIKNLIFRTNAVNSIPCKCELQIFFMDDGFMIIDSLYYQKPLFIDKASVDNNGMVSAEYSLQKHDTELTDNQIEIIRDVKSIGVRIFMLIEDYSDNKAHYYNDQSLSLQFGVTAELELTY